VEFDEKRQQVEALAAFLRHWAELAKSLFDASKRLADVDYVAPHNKDVNERLTASSCALVSMRAGLQQVLGALWVADDVAKLEAQRAESKLIEVQQCLDAVFDLVDRGADGLRRRSLPEDAIESASTDPRARVAGASPIPTMKMLRTADWMMAALAFVIAFLGWLTESYLGKPFGSAIWYADYLQAFLWGYGMKTGLEALNFILGKLQTLGTRLR